MDTLHTQVEEADTLAALAEAHIAPVVAAHRLEAGVCIVPALVLAAEQPAGPGALRPQGRLARHSQRAR